MAGDLDHDVVGLDRNIAFVARQTLQARGAGGEDLHRSIEGLAAAAVRRRLTTLADRLGRLRHLGLLAKPHLGRDVGTRDRERARLAAAAIVFFDAPVGVLVHEGIDHLERCVRFHGAVAGVVIHVAGAGHAFEAHAFFHQEFMDVEDAAAREDAIEFVFLELVVAGAARHHHRLDVEVIERVGDPVKEHPVVGDDLVGLVELARAALRITAAQIARWQHGLYADMPEHRLRGQTDLREQPLGAAARKIEDRLGIDRHRARIADDRHIARILDVEQRARRLLGQIARHLLVDEVDHLLGELRFSDGGRRLRGLGLGRRLEHIVGNALRLVAPVDHDFAGEIDRARIGRVQKEHRGGRARVEALLAHLAQQVAHRHRDITEVDIDRAWRGALVADRAVIGDIAEFIPVPDGDTASGLLLIEEGFDEQRCGQDFVARTVEQIGPRHMGRADRLALAATQAVLDRVGNRADVGLLHDQRLGAHQPEARGIGIAQIAIDHQLAAVEATLGIDSLLVVAKLGEFLGGQELELGDADAVFTRDDAVERAGQRHDAHHRLIGLLQHRVVVGIDRQIGVHIAVAGMHVQRHEHPTAQHLAVQFDASLKDRTEGLPGKHRRQRGKQLGLPGDPDRAVLQKMKEALAGIAGRAGLGGRQGRL